MNDANKHIKYAIGLGVFMACVGTFGYKFVFKWPFIDSVYMTVITLTTVGFSEVKSSGPLTSAERIFTMFLILGGVATIAYSLRIVAEYVVEQNLFANLGRRRMEKRIAQLKDHIILCGYGRIGQHAADALRSSGKPFVVVDKNITDAQFTDGTMHIIGEATDEDVLKAAGLERAATLIAVVGSDADNLFITMTARVLNPKLRIISRAAEASVRNKMLRAGADSVVLPYEIGGRRIASMVLMPSVCEFLDTVVYTGGEELRMEEVEVLGSAWIKGKNLFSADVRRRTGVAVLAVKKHDGAMLSTLSDITINTGDRLICLGTAAQLDKMRKISSLEREPE